MSARTHLIKPQSNWHRMLHILDANDGTLYLAQMYAPRSRKSFEDTSIKTNMPFMTPYKTLGSASMHYENQAERMGWVIIQRWNNRTWVTILPKGRSILKTLDEGNNWDRYNDKSVAVFNPVKISFVI